MDAKVDRRLEDIGTDEALSLRGKAAVAQAQVAYANFRRFVALVAPPLQRPLWASTSTKNPAYDPLLFVNSLIGPDTVNTLPLATLGAFNVYSTVAVRIDDDAAFAQHTLDKIADVGVDLSDVAEILEREGVAAFNEAHQRLLDVLGAKLTA